MGTSLSEIPLIKLVPPLLETTSKNQLIWIIEDKTITEIAIVNDFDLLDPPLFSVQIINLLLML